MFESSSQEALLTLSITSELILQQGERDYLNDHSSKVSRAFGVVFQMSNLWQFVRPKLILK
jgi:hypothetical protein